MIRQRETVDQDAVTHQRVRLVRAEHDAFQRRRDQLSAPDQAAGQG
ncbi:hypothetical protein ACQP1V_25860 [Microtetraspora malaysiensis]